LKWIEIKRVIGTDALPPRAAFVIQQAIKKAVENGDVRERNKWQLLEYLAADYLAGN
jgi:hypothetical protein